MMQKITPHFWFNDNAEEAMNFYVSVFPNSKILNVTKYPESSTEEQLKNMAGKVLNGQFELEGYQFQCLDGGPLFTPNPSISFFINCDNNQEADERWARLSDGGTVLMEMGEYPFSPHYGWVQDKFGISWQIIVSANPNGNPRPKIMPSLMFVGDNNGKAQEAINYYISLFPDSKIGQISHYPADMAPDKESSVAYGDFMLTNQWFAAMDSGRQHEFQFNEAISFIVECQDQKEVDHYWQMSASPDSEQCGWLKDKFGISWQIVPKQLGELLSNPDKDARDKVLHAMLQMKKLSIDNLEKAAKE